MSTTALVNMNGSTDYLDFTAYTSDAGTVVGESLGAWTLFTAVKIGGN